MTSPAPPPRHPEPRLGAGLARLASDKDLLLCDVWGVVHNGERHHAGAVDALLRFRRGEGGKAGGTVILVTNAPAPERQVRDRLDRLAVPRACYDRIATSGDVAAAMIAEAGCPPLHAIGPEREPAICREAARLAGRAPPGVAVADAEVVLAIGLDDTGDRAEDYDALLREMRARRLPMICANPDLVVEVGDALIVCAGAIAARYAAMGGEVRHAGKPHPAIYARALAMAEAIRGPTPPSRILAIGDAAATDLAGAAREGIDALFITAGIHRERLHPAGTDGAGTDGAGMCGAGMDAAAVPDGSALDAPALATLLAEHGTPCLAALPRLLWEG